jgi:hypothetical protein
MLHLDHGGCSKKWKIAIRDKETALNQFIIKFNLDISEINKEVPIMIYANAKSVYNSLGGVRGGSSRIALTG